MNLPDPDPSSRCEDSEGEDGNKCPHCGRPGVSKLEQFCHSGRGVFSMRCKYCRKLVAVHTSGSCVVLHIASVISAVILLKLLEAPVWVGVSVVVLIGLVLTPLRFRMSRFVKREL